MPHIAAGINLNMPVVGRFLRRGGAFFLRRSFAGNTLYTAVFTTYLGQMMARGHSIEYFIEGGRSRHGPPAATTHRHAGDDGAQLRTRAATPGRVRARCTSATSGWSKAAPTSASCRDSPKEKESVLSLLSAHSGAAQPLRQGVRELRRAAVARCADPAARARLESPAHRLGRTARLAHADDRRSGAPDHGADQRGRLRDPDQPRRTGAARDAAPEHGRGGSRSTARALRIAAAPGAVLAARLGHRRRTEPRCSSTPSRCG